MVVLVTGGAGFVGRHVCDLLHLKGIDFISGDNYDLRCGSTLADRPYPSCFLEIRDREELDKFILAYGVTDIIHLAAYGRNLTCQDFPVDAWDVNVTGTRNVLEAARVHKLNRVVVCSSNIVLSPVETVYKTTKKATEALVAMYAKMGLSVMGLRPSNIYGAGQSRTEYQPCAFAGLDMSFERSGHFEVTGSGTQTRDFVHVDDVARAFYVALDRTNISGRTVDICTGRQYSINDVASFMNVPIHYVEARPGDAPKLVSDPFIADALIGFQAEMKLNQHVHEAFPAVQASRHGR